MAGEEQLVIGHGNNLLVFTIDLANGALAQTNTVEGHRGAVGGCNLCSCLVQNTGHPE